MNTKPVITVYQLPQARSPGWKRLVNTSPTCFELETWLRITGIPYEVGPFPPPVAPPKGKFPFISDDGVLIGDTTFIIDHLKRTRGVDPDQGLTVQEKAIGTAFRRMVKENLYWVIVQQRWRDQAGWEVYSSQVVAYLVGGDGPDTAHEARQAIQKVLLDQLNGHGMGRHTDEEIQQIGIADLAAISDFLGDKPFFFGDKPTGVDATIHSHVASFTDIPLDCPSTQFIRQRRNLVDYCQRMRERYFSDLPAS